MRKQAGGESEALAREQGDADIELGDAKEDDGGTGREDDGVGMYRVPRVNVVPTSKALTDRKGIA